MQEAKITIDGKKLLFITKLKEMKLGQWRMMLY
jgi:hypothetical protein